MRFLYEQLMPDSSIDIRTSRLIGWLRFPLIVMVIMIHSRVTSVSAGGTSFSITGSSYPVYLNLSYFISEIVARSAVPLFFIFSGYLYFHNLKQWEWKTYFKKTGNRFFSLVIPYVIWNVFALAIYAMIQRFFPGTTSGNVKLISEYGITDYFRVFWNIMGTRPLCYPLWFIRDLIILCILSPFVYLLVRYGGACAVSLLAVVYLSGFSGSPAKFRV